MNIDQVINVERYCKDCDKALIYPREHTVFCRKFRSTDGYPVIAADARNDETKCGMDARFFEQVAEEEEQPPIEWVEHVIYMAIAVAAFLAVLVVIRGAA